jgi:hypothetical protein
MVYNTDENIVTLGTVMPSTADVVLNLHDKGQITRRILLKEL